MLDFNQNESDRVGLNKGHSGWLNSILGGQPTNTGNRIVLFTTFRHCVINFMFFFKENYNKESLTEAFVKFLEKESSPRTKPNDMPNLMNVVQPIQISSEITGVDIATSSTTTKTTTNTSVPINVAVQPMLFNEGLMQSFVPERNSSSILKDILSDS